MNHKNYIFNHFNIITNFHYSKEEPNPNEIKHIFFIENKFDIIFNHPEAGIEDRRVADHFIRKANKLASESSYHREIITSVEVLPKETIDEIINQLNQCLYELDEFLTEGFPASIKTHL